MTEKRGPAYWHEFLSIPLDQFLFFLFEIINILWDSLNLFQVDPIFVSFVRPIPEFNTRSIIILVWWIFWLFWIALNLFTIFEWVKKILQNKIFQNLLKKLDFPDFDFSLYFLAYLRSNDDPVPENKNDRFSYALSQKAVLELTHNWDYEDLDKGRNFGHLAFSVPNIYETCKKLMDKGVIINRPPRDGRMAFIKSPNNISIELLQQGEALEIKDPWKSMDNTGTW